MDKNIKYLVNNNRNDKEMLEKGQYNFRDHSPDEVSAAIDEHDDDDGRCGQDRRQRKRLCLEEPTRSPEQPFDRHRQRLGARPRQEAGRAELAERDRGGQSGTGGDRASEDRQHGGRPGPQRRRAEGSRSARS